MKQNKKLIKEIPTLSGKDADRFARKMLDMEKSTIKIPKGGYTKRDKLVRRETIKEMEEMIDVYEIYLLKEVFNANIIKAPLTAQSHKNIIDNLLKQQLKNMRDDDGKKEM